VNARLALCTLALAAASLAPDNAWAQRFEVGVTFGHGVATTDEFQGVHVWPEPQPVQMPPLHSYGKRRIGPVLGVGAAYWPTRLVGVEVCLSWSSVVRTVGTTDYVERWPVKRSRDTLVAIAVRVAVRSDRSDRPRIQFAAGPELVRRQYGGRSVPIEYSGLVYLRPRSAWGASASGAVLWPLTRRLSVHVGADARLLRLPFATFWGDDTFDRPLRLELVPTVGVVVSMP